jgi:hypothetical protein
MEYPKWLEDEDNWAEDLATRRLVEMCKDAWAMCYLRGTGGGMGVEEFLQKYQDEPTNEIPYIALDHPNDGSPV